MKTSDFSRELLGTCATIAILAGCAAPPSATSTLPDSMAQVSSVTPQRHDADSSSHPEPDNQLNGHLYVAASGTYSSAGLVERFRIAHGVPEPKPDRTYPGVGAPIAVDSAGYLYATLNGSFGSLCAGYPGAFVVVYPPHSNKSVRMLTVSCTSPVGNGAAVTSLFADSHGYLYVGVAGFNGQALSWYVNVYSPGASGYEPSVQQIDYGSCNSVGGGCEGMAGLAGDLQGNLHVSVSSGNPHPKTPSVLSFASPTTDPTQIADLTGSGIVAPLGLAIDTSNELYVDNSDGTSSFVSAYRAKANGNLAPDREISVVGEQWFGIGIATGAGRLIIPDSNANVVYAVHARKNGVQSPIWTLSLSPGFSPLDVKLGP
jgi:hypothetical protein